MRPFIAMLIVPLIGCVTTTTTTERSAPPRDGRPSEARRQAADPPLPPGVARVTIDRYEFSHVDRSVIEAVVKYRDADVAVSAGRLGGRNGLVIFAAESGVAGAIRAAQQSTTTQSTSSQFLLLDEGAAGSIAMLESRLEPWAVVIPIHRGAVVVETIAETITGTGMAVGVDRVGPDAVTVRLQPYFNRRMGRERLFIDELTTTVTLRPGVRYVVMSNQSSERSVAEALLSRRTMEQTREVIAVLSVDVAADERLE